MTDAGDNKRQGMKAWFEKTGFPLEFETHEAMTAIGFRTEMGSRYEAGGDSGKLRETDLVGEEPEATDGRQVLVVAECKHASRPWLVRCQPSPEPEELVGDLLMHRDLGLPLRAYVTDTDDLPFFVRRTGSLGFGVTEGPEQHAAMRRDRDQPYAALQSIVAAARALGDQRSVYDNPWLVWPVVVIDGELWTASSAGATGATIDQTDWQRIRWRDAPGKTATLVDIVTKSALATYLHDLRGDTMWLAHWMERLPPPSFSLIG